MADDQTQDETGQQDPQDDQLGTSDNQNLVDPDDIKHQQSKPPSVTGEEDAFSGGMPAESPDIDEEMAKIGEHIDPEHPKPLGED